MKDAATDNSYYLPEWRSVIIGVILMLMGISISFIGFDRNGSFWENFQGMIIDFRGVASFFVSLLMLVLKAGFLLMAYLLFKNRGRILRAKTDHKGFYFKKITGTNKYERGLSDLNPLVFIPYKNIVDIRLVRSPWSGMRLELETAQGRQVLTMLNVLTRKEKVALYESIKRNIDS